MKRCKEFEKAVRNLLDIKNIPYREFQYRCPKCGTIINAKASGMPDFLCLHPFFGIECKTGTGTLNKNQKEVRKLFLKSGIPYIVARDNIDSILNFLEEIENGYN
jgi:hypothetical protein